MSANLIPMKRRLAGQRRRHLRFWSVTCGVCLLAVLFASIQVQLADGGQREHFDSRFSGYELAASKTRSRIEELYALQAQAKATLEANRAIGRQPDWSVLLALLGETLEEHIVLSDCELQTGRNQTDASAGSKAGDPMPLNRRCYRLEIHGFGKSQSAISQFVLRLERYDLFREVRLINSTRASLGGAEMLSFRIECVI